MNDKLRPAIFVVLLWMAQGCDGTEGSLMTDGDGSADPGDGGVIVGDGAVQVPAGLRISPTLYATFFLEDGVASGVGNNSNGHLGVDDIYEPIYKTPKALAFPSGTVVAQVAAGGHGGAALDDKGQVYTWGDNMTGELGIGSMMQVSPPKPELRTKDIDGNAFDHVTKLALGYQFVGALKSDHTVWVWGLNGSDGSTPAHGVTGKPIPTGACPWGGPGVENCYTTAPNQIIFPVGTVIRDIFAGSFSMLALDTDDNVWAWGGYAANDNSSTNVPVKRTGIPKIKSLSATGGGALAVDYAKSLWQWGSYGAPYKVTGLEDFAALDGHVEVAIASGHSVHVIDDQHRLWGWGDQQVGEVGNGPTGLDVLSVDTNGCFNASYDYSTTKIVDKPALIMSDVQSCFSNAYSYSVFAVKLDGTIWAWGRNKNFGLGDNPPLPAGGKDCSPDPYPVDTYAVGTPKQLSF